MPNLITPPSGCRFLPRCKFMQEICVSQEPPLEKIGGGREVSCHRWKEISLEGTS